MPTDPKTLAAANERATVHTALRVGRAIKAGARLRNVRLADPDKPEEGIVVHLDEAEAEAVTAVLASVLAKRLAV